MSETFILCEGYHDRAFWSGWLSHLACTNLGAPVAGSTRISVKDPWNDPVEGGQYGFQSPVGHFIRVVPARGDSKRILALASNRLKKLGSKPLRRLVLNIDPDGTAVGTVGAAGLKQHDVLQFALKFDTLAAINADSEIELHGGTTRIGLIRWETSDLPTPGLPDQQTLERLVCAALLAAYPGRAKAVQDWLDTRPDKPPVNPKDHSWSYMAGWYADHGCEDFFTNLWRDLAIVPQLESRLRLSGAWQLAERITQ